MSRTDPIPASGPSTAAADASQPVEPNYRYWREHGQEWADEYEVRKQRLVLYHIQELMLVDYARHHAPAKVLDFGCGVGRHLRNLSQLPGIEVFGFDQSATMVAHCLRWTGEEWLAGHVTVGSPIGPLPYADCQFDLVYTTEVLVHVRPEHLDGILGELLRVCSGQVLHLEPSYHASVDSASHEGCWRHDLVAAYARLGHRCELLPSGYGGHAPYRVVLDERAVRFSWSPVVLSMYRAMEAALERGFADREDAVGRLTAQVQAEGERRAAVERQLEELASALEAHRAALADERTRTAAERARLEQRIAALVRQRETFLRRVTEHLRK